MSTFASGGEVAHVTSPAIVDQKWPCGVNIRNGALLVVKRLVGDVVTVHSNED